MFEKGKIITDGPPGDPLKMGGGGHLMMPLAMAPDGGPQDKFNIVRDLYYMLFDDLHANDALGDGPRWGPP